MQSTKAVSGGRPPTLLEPLLATQSGSPATDGRTVSNEESKGSDVVRTDIQGRSIDDIVDSLGK
jgi:hypothetical protein